MCRPLLSSVSTSICQCRNVGDIERSRLSCLVERSSKEKKGEKMRFKLRCSRDGHILYGTGQKYCHRRKHNCKECYPKLKAVPWAQVPHKSLRIECPLDGDIAWLNINGIVFCSKGHFVTLTTEAIQEVQPKLAKIRVYP